MIRVSLDANVLFSAAYAKGAWFSELWDDPDLDLHATPYAASEARRNLDLKDRHERLDGYLHGVNLVSASSDQVVQASLLAPWLPTKDLPILAGAIAAGAAYLLTADDRHFGAAYGKKLGGVEIVSVYEFLKKRRTVRRKSG